MLRLPPALLASHAGRSSSWDAPRAPSRICESWHESAGRPSTTTWSTSDSSSSRPSAPSPRSCGSRALSPPGRPEPSSRTAGSETGFRVAAAPRRPGRRAWARQGSPRCAYWLDRRSHARLRRRMRAGCCGGSSPDSGTATTRDPRRLAGVATARDVAQSASKKALLARGRTLRPSLDRPRAADVGYLLGRSRGQDVWASVEDSILLLGPPRSGKGLHVVINAILDAPGAVITTATRPDNIAATLHRPSATRPGRGLRPAAPGRRAPRGPALVTRPRLRGPAHRDDPRHRPRLRHRPVDRRRRVRRLLGRQDPHRPPGPAARRRPRPPHPARAVRLDALALGRRRRRRDPRQPPRRRSRLGRLAGVDDPLRPPHPRLDLDGRLPRALLPRRPARPRRRQPRPPASTSTPPTSSPATAPSTCSPPAPAPAPPGRSSPPSSKTSSRPPGTSPPPRPAPASTRPCCWPSTRSATSHRCPPCRC